MINVFSADPFCSFSHNVALPTFLRYHETTAFNAIRWVLQCFLLNRQFRSEAKFTCCQNHHHRSSRGISWCDDSLALVYESWYKTWQIRTWVVPPASEDVTPHILFDRSSEDVYSDPGSPMLRRTKAGTYVIANIKKESDEGRYIILNGDGATPEGNVPFLDLFDLWWSDEKSCYSLKTKSNTAFQATRVSAVAPEGTANQSNGKLGHGSAGQSLIGSSATCVPESNSVANDRAQTL